MKNPVVFIGNRIFQLNIFVTFNILFWCLIKFLFNHVKGSPIYEGVKVSKILLDKSSTKRKIR